MIANPAQMWRRRRVSALAALGAAALISVPLAAPAQAADLLIDPSATGSLTITTSKVNGVFLPSGNGTQEPDVSNMEPIGGAELTLCLVEGLSSYQLTSIGVSNTSDPAWWDMVAKIVEASKSLGAYQFFNTANFANIGLNPSTFPPNLVRNMCQKGTTDASGQVVFTPLPQGLYYIRESNSPADVDPGAPFFVTVPMTNPEGTGWMYDVYAYPKGTLNNTHKYVDDSAAVSVGDTVDYTITMSIPATGSNGFRMSDPVPTTLQIDPTSIAVSIVDSADIDTVAAAAPVLAGGGVDYTVVIDDSTPPGYRTDMPAIAAGSNNTLNIEFTSDGLDKLSDAYNLVTNATVKVTFSTIVQANMINKCAGAVAACNTVDLVTNQAYYYPSLLSWGPTPKPSLTEEVTVHFGGVNVHKVDQNGDAITGGFSGGTPLASAAQFMLFKTEADAKAYGTAADPSALVDTAITAIAVKDGLRVYDADNDVPAQWQATKVFTTDADGSAAMLGLSVKTGTDATCGFVGDLDNNPTMVSGPALGVAIGNSTLAMSGSLYWGLEIKAPEGYDLQPKPFPVCVASFLDGDIVGTSYDDLHVVNVLANAGFTMPLTGWNGVQSTIASLGFVFFMFALIYAIRQRREIGKSDHL
ncbi:MAG: SpaH/EbpB family LPXTG-anchored major pilin [Cellulomonadaceae bacterium]|jgi:fimbrial isopeptide formation D2 family protein|nr:SpaH/EbpB family LPXTG-anchored major pilin [Cellulomonadaceae bacterium]